MGNCTDIKYKFYNGGWSNWQTSLTGGYAGNASYVAVLKFKTPALSSSYTHYTGSKLTVKVPYVKYGSITLYARLLTSDPTGALYSKNIGTIPNSSNATASASATHNDSSVHTVTFTINNAKPDTTYYLVIGANTTSVQIGYNGYDSYYDFNLTYTGYTLISASKPTITDYGDNGISIVCSKGTAGTNNAIKSATLYWSCSWNDSKKDWNWNTVTLSSSPHTQWITLRGSNLISHADTKQFVAEVRVTGTYNNVTSSRASLDVKQYWSPYDPGIPTITQGSYKNGRLVAKQDWTFTWIAASKVNNSSPVLGYRIRIYKNGGEIMYLKYNANDGNRVYIDSNPDKDHPYWWISGDPNITSIKFKPEDLGLKPGDRVAIGIIGYSKNGKGETMWVGNCDTSSGKAEDIVQKNSITHTVQNAGVMWIYNGSSWVEGQVYVKTGSGNTAADWTEAEVVKVYNGSSWVEAQ